MIKYCSLVLNIFNMYHITGIFHPEYLVYKYLKLISINIVEFKYDYILTNKRK